MRIRQQNKKKDLWTQLENEAAASPATRWCWSAWLSARQLPAASAKLCTQHGMWKRGDMGTGIEPGNREYCSSCYGVEGTEEGKCNQAIGLWLTDTIYFICLALGLCKFDDLCPWSSSTYSHCYESFCMCQMTQMFLPHSLSSNVTEQLLGLTGKKSHERGVISVTNSAANWKLKIN